jgi:VanZ family protein
MVFIVFAVVPWYDIQNHSHWMNVQWIPFVSPPIKLVDIVINVLLYVPFGYWYARGWSQWRGKVARAILAAAVVSLLTEWTQLYSHSRFPSLSDTTNNIIGAALGAWLAGQVGERATGEQTVNGRYRTNGA